MESPKEFTPEWFDWSSKMWEQNKKRVGYSYEYVCKKDKCKNKPFKGTEWCKWHQAQELRRSPRLAEKN